MRQRETVVFSFSDVFGNLPDDSGRPEPLVDFDTDLNEQFNNGGKIIGGRYPIGAWPGIARHGLVELDRLRAAQCARVPRLHEVQKFIQRLLAGLDPYEQQTLDSVRHQRLVAVVNHAPRTKSQLASGKNGSEFHYGKTRSGLEVVAHPEFFRGLLHAGQLVEESFARIPNEAAVEAGIWNRREQYRSRFAAQLVNHPDLFVPAATRGKESAIGEDPRPNGGVKYVDKFGNLLLDVVDLRRTGNLLREYAGKTLDLNFTNYANPEQQYSVGVHIGESLATAPRDQFVAFLNQSDYTPNSELPEGYGTIELLRPVDDPNDRSQSAYVALANLLTDGNATSFSPNQLETFDVQFSIPKHEL